jgi:ELWxxDGT repeat protein
MGSPVLLKEFVWNFDVWTYRSEPGLLTPFRSGIVFAGEYDGGKSRDLWQGKELWQSNGTVEGTLIAADIHKGVPELNISNGASRPHNFISFGQSIFFVAEEPFGGKELWSFNGKNARRVKDLRPGIYGYEDLSLWGVLGKKLFFQAGGALWTSDGSKAGTKPLIFDAASKGGLYGLSRTLANDDIASFRGDFYFPYRNVLGRSQIWRTDGTAKGTLRIPLKDTDAVFPEQLTPSRTSLFFTAIDYTSDAGRELWKTDGTSKGTVLVKAINPTPSSEGPTWLTMCGGYLFFSADDGIHGRDLWMSDGTTKGTRLAKNIAPEILPGVRESSNPSQLTAVGDILYFVANDGPRGPELWKTDTRNLRTAIVKDITTGFFGTGSSIRNLTAVGNKLFFTTDNTSGSNLWVTDGSTGGTLQIKEATGRSISEITLSGAKLFWSEGDQLWALDVKDELTGMGSRLSTPLDRTSRLRSAVSLAPSLADSAGCNILSTCGFAHTPSSPLVSSKFNPLGSCEGNSSASPTIAMERFQPLSGISAEL